MTLLPSPEPLVRKVFICNSGKCADSQQALEIYETLVGMIHEQGLDRYDSPHRIKCLLSGCFDICKNGPLMVVHPGAVYYQHVDLPKLQTIFEQHLLCGEIVEAYVYHRENQIPTRD